MMEAVVVAGCAVFLLAGTLLHFLRRDVRPLEQGMSSYAEGRHGWIMAAAFLALAAAYLAASLQAAAIPRILLAGAGIGLAGVALFPSAAGGPGFRHRAHRVFAMLFFALACAAGLLRARDAGSMAAAALACLLFPLSMIPGVRFRGLWQRACFILLVAGLAVLS